VAGVRAKVASHAARSQQLIGKQANLGRSHDVSLLIVVLILWILIFVVGYFNFDPPENLGLFQLMAGGPALKSVDSLALYWLTWLTLAGIGLTSVGYGFSMISLRRMVRLALPRAPLISGAPPRCRVCGAELCLEGRVRRCDYCGADHLLMGERYAREDARLDGELARMETELNATLERKVQRADKLLWWFSGLMPIVSVPAIPVAAFLLDAPTRGLVVFPLLALALGLALVTVGALMSVPNIRTRGATRPGDVLLVQGQPMKALARIKFGVWPFAGTLFLCHAGDSALEGVFIVDDEQPCYRVTFDGGGSPMTAQEVERAKVAGVVAPESWHTFDISGADDLGGSLRGATAVWYYAPAAKHPAEMVGARLWFGERPDQRSDRTPSLTVRGVLRMDSDTVRLMQ
jgi:hypothetical protein